MLFVAQLPRETEDNAYAKFWGDTSKEHCGMLWYFLLWSIHEIADDFVYSWKKKTKKFFYQKDDNGEFWVEVLNVTFLDVVETPQMFWQQAVIM